MALATLPPSACARAAPPAPRRRPIFVWQLRFFTATLLLAAAQLVPQTLRQARPYLASTLHTVAHALPPDPCLGLAPSTSAPRAAGDGAKRAPPPRLHFTHVPRAAGGLVARLFARYAAATGGTACRRAVSGAILVDGDARPPARAHWCQTVRAFGAHPAAAGALDVVLLRDPVARFVSVYEAARRTSTNHSFAHGDADDGATSSTTTKKTKTGGAAVWTSAGAHGLSLTGLASDFANSSSVLHAPYVDEQGQAVPPPHGLAARMFYGALPALAARAPRFEGAHDPFHFGYANGGALGSAAKQRVCRAAVVGTVDDVGAFVDALARVVQPWVGWTARERAEAARVVVNRGTHRVSRNVDDHLPERMRVEVERRLRDEMDVYEFAKRVAAYRAGVQRAQSWRWRR